MTPRPAGSTTLAYESAANIVVAAHGSQEVPLEEFRAHLHWCGEHVIRGLLVRADDVALTARQRADFREFWDGRQAPPFALLAGAATSRGMLTALTWTGYEPPMRAFIPTDYAGALDFLGVTNVIDRMAVLTALGRVQSFVSGDFDNPQLGKGVGGVPAYESARKLRMPSKV